MTFDELVNLTKVKMEEFTPFAESAMLASSQSVGFEVKPIVSYIEQTMSEAANSILMVIPLRLIMPTEMTIIEHKHLPNGVGVLGLTDDFLRLHTLQMQTWDKPVHYITEIDDPLYVLQHNPYTMGSFHKPVVVMNTDLSVMPMNKALRYYSCPKEDAERNISASWQVSVFDKDEIQADLAEFYATKCASIVYGIYGMTDQKTHMETELQGLIEAR